MSSHSRRNAVAVAVAGAVALGAFAGPAMAAGDGASPAGDMRKSGGEPPEMVSTHAPGGGGTPSIIAVL